MMILLFLLFTSLLIYYLVFLSGIYKGIPSNPRRCIHPINQSINHSINQSSNPRRCMHPITQSSNQSINHPIPEGAGIQSPKGQASNQFSIPAEYISIIIPFRNEEENILNCLRSLEAQDYPTDKYEVIFVNDSSSDNGPVILSENIIKPNFILLNISKNSGISGKKKAVAYGISQSRGEIIVTTDADCIHQKNWLRSIVSCYDKNTGMVTGSVEYYDCKTFFRKLQQIEFAGLISAGAGLIGNKTPVICNAANLSYRKKIFNDLNGFNNNLHISSGDDGFLLQEISKRTDYEIKFCTCKDSVVKTKPSGTLAEFLQQRKRWAGKGLHYNDKILVLKLFAVFLFYAGLALQLFLGFFYGLFLVSFLLSYFLKSVSEFFLLKKGIKNLSIKADLKYFMPAEIFHMPYILITTLSGIFGSFEWKGRTLHSAVKPKSSILHPEL